MDKSRDLPIRNIEIFFFSWLRTSGGLEVVAAMANKPELERLSLDGNQLGEAGAKLVRQRMRDLGLQDILQPMEDNEEPDEDEEDPELDEDDDEDANKAGLAIKKTRPKKPTKNVFLGFLKIFFDENYTNFSL
jgi:hypothetical protein